MKSEIYEKRLATICKAIGRSRKGETIERIMIETRSSWKTVRKYLNDAIDRGLVELASAAKDGPKGEQARYRRIG